MQVFEKGYIGKYSLSGRRLALLSKHKWIVPQGVHKFFIILMALNK